MSPRQRMINLMYIVLTAMLALNVSSDVLNGFRQVQDSLQTTTENMTARNDAQFRYLEQLHRENPKVVEPWLRKGRQVKDSAQSLYLQIENIKKEIARSADGEDGNYRHLVNEDNLDASTDILLNPLTNRGAKLRKQIDSYRKLVLANITDPTRRKAYEQMLSTAVPRRPGTVGATSWEQASFENMPAIAAVTYLTHMQNNIRQAESDAMSSIVGSVNSIYSIDPTDVRVNKLSAYVIPQSTMIMRGGKYTSDIVLAAIDSTAAPRVVVGGREIPGGHFEIGAGSTGTFDYSGFIEVLKADGSASRYPFTSSYTVIEPMATISPTMMNVLYAGIDNPISISVPGVPMGSINASITSGSLTRKGDVWVAHVSNVGHECDINVTATVDGRSMNVGSMKFRIRKLPDPLPYIAVRDAKGNASQYKGSPRRLSKPALLSAGGVSAALDDGILNITYQVVSFSTVSFDQMGNAIPENSAGSKFSSRQLEQFKRLKVGKSFFITNIKAKGPDDITRDIPPMEVTLN